jgi:hypothetical protein
VLVTVGGGKPDFRITATYFVPCALSIMFTDYDYVAETFKFHVLAMHVASSAPSGGVCDVYSWRFECGI